MDTKDYIQSGLIESYVLGLTSKVESAELEKRMRENTSLAQSVKSFSTELEKNVLTHPIQPPAELKAKIMSSLFANNTVTITLPSFTTDNESFSGISSVKTGFWRYIAAASVLLLLVSAAFDFYFYQNYQRAQNNYQALLSEKNSMQASLQVIQTNLKVMDNSMQIMNGAETRKVKMNGTPGHETSLATVYWNMQSRDVYIMADKLPKTPQGKQYQLWAIVDGKPVDAGMLNNDCPGGFCKMKNIPNAQAFAITLEQQGGSATPTLTQMYTMGNV